MSCEDSRACGSSCDLRIIPYCGFTAFTPALPDFYGNVYDAEQRIKHICCEIDKLVNYADMLGRHINVTHEEVEQLKRELQNLKDGRLLRYYIDQIYEWIQTNMRELMSAAVKQVYFGLSDDGYFVAYVPDSWREITFDTGTVYGRTDYGRLVLRFDAEGNAIDNTYSYSLSQTPELSKLIADLEVNARRTDSAFDTLYTNLDKPVRRAEGNI